MKDGWYKVKTLVKKHNKKVEEDATLLSVNNEWWRDFDSNDGKGKAFCGEVLKVYSQEPVKPFNDSPAWNCKDELAMELLMAIGQRAIKDYITASLKILKKPDSVYSHRVKRECEKYLDGFEVNNQSALKLADEYVEYVIFSKNYGCKKCKIKPDKCPHKPLNTNKTGDFSQFGKVGCLKDENSNS